MAKVVIIGAGFAGQTAALYLGNDLGRDHEITVVNRNADFGYTPSWVWVGVGRMDVKKTVFPLKPVYDRINVNFVHGKVTEIHPDSDDQYVMAEKHEGGEVRLDYDYLLIATGAKLNFEGTPGLGPHVGYTSSICTPDHAVEASKRYLESVARMQKGEKQTIVIGTGHPGATCQGAALEYVSNVHKDLARRGVRDKANIIYLSNEAAVGDFGVRGLQVRQKNQLVTSETFIKAAFNEFGITPMARRGVKEVSKDKAYWEDYEGNYGETDFDFAMLIPQFKGVPFKYFNKEGEDISKTLTNAGDFVLVDAIYGLDYETLADTPEAWPAVYQNRTYHNIFAAGIAFAPPGSISVPHTTKNGTKIVAAPPRTGMVSGIIGRIVALNIIDLIKHGRMTHSERMTEMAAACIASMGDSLWDGAAATILIYPVVPDFRRYPNEAGRDLFVSDMEMGLAGAWMKRLIHTTFMHKLQSRIGWRFIPE